MIINMNNRTVSPQRRVPPISQPRLIPGSKNKIEFHYGQTQRPLGRVGPAVQTLQPGQGIPPRAGSSFLSYPVHVSQQQIPLSSLGLRKVVEGPTVQWPSTRKSFLGAATTGEFFGQGISSDPDFMAKGFGLHKQQTSVYCPVCQKSYPSSNPSSLQEHIQYHRQLDQIQNQQIVQQSKLTHRRTAILSQAGLSEQTVHAPLIIQPQEFVIEQRTPAINNLFVVNSAVGAIDQHQSVRNIEMAPLQYPIQRANAYSCLDGCVNQDSEFRCRDVCARNQVIARPRQLTEWEIEKKAHRMS